jgi:uncharacterized lipoprotein YmbA
MTRCRSVWSSAVLPLLAACGSVEVPRERLYRLELPSARRPDPGRAGVLRVQDLQLGTALDGDRLLVQRGVQVEPRPLDRWIAPLDRLVTDALVLGLSRARVCDLVKGAADAGTENWTLHGRIVEFGEARGVAGAEARVTIELWLEERGTLVFHDEFAVVEVLSGQGPEAAVAGLSTGLLRVVDGVVERMQARGLFAAARPPAAPAAR